MGKAEKVRVRGVVAAAAAVAAAHEGVASACQTLRVLGWGRWERAWLPSIFHCTISPQSVPACLDGPPHTYPTYPTPTPHLHHDKQALRQAAALADRRSASVAVHALRLLAQMYQGLGKHAAAVKALDTA